MMKRFKVREGFTLIELMVVVTIIAILAALIVPALQRAQAKAMGMNCMSRAKSIGSAIRTYASNYDGWTCSIKGSYVREFGYKLNHEAGYFLGDAANNWMGKSTPTQSEAYAGQVRDFRCPIHADPTSGPHGIPSSYQITSLWNGGNIMAQTGSASAILALREAGKRHPSHGETFDQHYVFADLHATLGYSGPALQGLKLKAWNGQSLAGIRGIAESKLPVSQYDGVFAGELSAGGNYRWHSFLDGLLSGSTDWDATYHQDGGHSHQRNHNWRGGWQTQSSQWNVGTTFGKKTVFRWDGGITFPTPADYQFRLRGTTNWHSNQSRMDIGIGAYGAEIDDASSIVFQGEIQQQDNGFPGQKYSILKTDKMYPFQFVRWHNDWNGVWEVRWRGTNPDTGAAAGPADEIIEGKYFGHRP